MFLAGFEELARQLLQRNGELEKENHRLQLERDGLKRGHLLLQRHMKETEIMKAAALTSQPKICPPA